ncbi:MAG: hypothetical protein JSU86_05345, partial [Phycisphaerales bacterium]
MKLAARLSQHRLLGMVPARSSRCNLGARAYTTMVAVDTGQDVSAKQGMHAAADASGSIGRDAASENVSGAPSGVIGPSAQECPQDSSDSGDFAQSGPLMADDLGPCREIVALNGRGRAYPSGWSFRGQVRKLLVWPMAGAALLALLAAFFVGWEVLEQRLVPNMSTGLSHLLLTVRAAIVMAGAGILVFLVMRGHNRRLSATAERLTQALESFRTDSPRQHRFENPHLVHCRDLIDCKRTECPIHDSLGERCWQTMALRRAELRNETLPIEIGQCMRCEVYRRSCPDKLTELGEAFNNLMFLLEAEGERLGGMRAQMLEKEKMVALGQLAAGIAHEVGNPLSSISSIAQMLKRKPTDPPMPEQLDLIETHIQRISETVRQLGTMARPTADRWERIDLGRTLDEAMGLISFDRRARRVDVDFAPPASRLETFALHDQLQQVFINLALNALDAMPNGGKLTIRAQKRRRNIMVRVQDSGSGIKPETGRRVFEPFFTTKEPGHGTGLGLAVSYSIVQKHGGSI